MLNTNSPEALVLQVKPVQGGLQVSIISPKLKTEFIIEEMAVDPLCQALKEAASKIQKIVLPG
jgi:hypothetical protein